MARVGDLESARWLMHWREAGVWQRRHRGDGSDDDHESDRSKLKQLIGFVGRLQLYQANFSSSQTSKQLPHIFPYNLLFVLRQCMYSPSSFLPISSLINSGFQCIGTYFVLSSAFKIQPPLVSSSNSPLPPTDPQVTLRKPDTAPYTSLIPVAY